MTSTFKFPNASISFVLALTAFFTVLIACEDPGSVGDQFSDQESEVIQDTLLMDSLGSVSAAAISGDRNFSTTGIYNDPIFGRHDAIALIRPGIGNVRTDTISEDIDSTTMTLQLVVNQNNIWGDTLATAEYELVEIAERWDQNNWKFKDEPSLKSNVVGEFSYQQGDTVDVPITSEWVSKYVEAFNMAPEERDSTFAQEIFGFAIVPKNNAKLLPINISNTALLINTATTENELNQAITESATSLVREQAPVFSGNNFELSSTLNNSVFIDVDKILNNLRSPILSAAFLTLRQNDSLTAASLPEHHIRPSLNETRLLFRSSSNIESTLLDGQRLGVVIPSSPNAARLELNITNNLQSLILDQDSTVNMYLVYGPGNGLIRSALYYGPDAPNLPPTVFITGLEPQ